MVYLKSILFVLISLFTSINTSSSILSIIMEDDCMLVKVSDPNTTIEKIEIFSLEGILVHSEDGCFANECSVDNEAICHGDYNIVISTPSETLTKMIQYR